MTSQRDETVGHAVNDEMTDDPIVVERHDEILGGPPADHPEADNPFARDAAADGSTPDGYQPGDGTASDRPGTDQIAGDERATGRPGPPMSWSPLARPRASWPAISGSRR